ncbi:unnamed protein product [Penicillium salamii]|nr:unnamed protein product [Penicillium salamii]CAG8152626.1 unnamed protein product [Penicillium salamii]CAG8402689.1 unnamed protein product [Penicillium salamii]
MATNKIRKRKRVPKSKRRKRDAGPATKPLEEVTNETKQTKCKPQKKAVPIPISEDPLEKNIPENTPMPEGYILVPKGDVYITRHCRSKTKDNHQIVYVVYNRTGKRTLGIRVPEEIHTTVLASAAATKESRANAVESRDKKDLSKSRALLEAEFPLMPAETLQIILEHAFLKGSGRVGRTGRISDEKKVLLAVEAHIRHVHTPYETLLEGGVGRMKAREMVRGSILAVERAWQGLLEEKEVIVLD